MSQAKTLNKKARKRVTLLEAGVGAYARLTATSDGLYRCPICAAGYTRTDAIEGKRLTLEHVPPNAIGGKRITLTCFDCNSGSGHKGTASSRGSNAG